jgi:predicted dehydrogenase
LKSNTNYPASILQPIDGSSYYRFNASVSYLFSLVTDAELADIENCKIYRRSYPQYIPWYNSRKGGGAITLGNGDWSRIYFTENYFSDDQNYFNGYAHQSNPSTWLRLASHEVSHIAHGRRFGSIIIYLIVFLYQYTLHGHDKAPLEIEADAGTSVYDRFSTYMKVNRGITIPELILSDSSEEEKIAVIKESWEEFCDK